MRSKRSALSRGQLIRNYNADYQMRPTGLKVVENESADKHSSCTASPRVGTVVEIRENTLHGTEVVSQKDEKPTQQKSEPSVLITSKDVEKAENGTPDTIRNLDLEDSTVADQWQIIAPDGLENGNIVSIVPKAKGSLSEEHEKLIPIINSEKRAVKSAANAKNDKKDLTRADLKYKKTKRSFVKTFLVGFIVLLLILVPVQFGLAHLLEQPVITGSEILPNEIKMMSVDPESPNYEVYKKAERVNILLLGLNGKLSDTMMLGSYDMDAQRIDVISIPRDTYFERPKAKTNEQRKLNAVYGNEGAEGAARAVGSILGGIPIHYYAVIKFQGVEKAVNAINGVPVVIPFNMDYDDPYDKPPLHIHFKKGEYVLDGKEAVKFLRFRKNNESVGGGYPDQDIGRTKAQQDFMKAALRKTMGLNLPKVISIIMENVESDVTNGVALKLAAKMAAFDMEDLYTHTLPGKEGNKDGLSYWFYNRDETEEMVKGIYASAVPGTSEAAIDLDEQSLP